MGGIVCTLAFRFVNLRGFRHSARVIRGDYSSRIASGRSLAVPGAEHRGVRHRGARQHRRRRGGGDAGRARRHVVDDARRLPRHEPQVRRSDAVGEIPARARRRHGDRRRDVLRARGARPRRHAAARQISRRLFLRGRHRRLGHHLPGQPGLFAGARSHGLRPGIPVRSHGRDLDRHRAVRRREAHREVDRQALAVHVPAVHRGLPRRARA